MAAPLDRTIHELSGIWVLNKALSDEFQNVLALQGVIWPIRRALGGASIALHTSQRVQDGVTMVEIDNKVYGIKGTRESRPMDWVSQEHKDYIWGAVRGRCRYVRTSEITGDDSGLGAGWNEETKNGYCVENEMADVNGAWSGYMVWGFETVNDERRFVRHVYVRRGEKSAVSRLVYDFVGSA